MSITNPRLSLNLMDGVIGRGMSTQHVGKHPHGWSQPPVTSGEVTSHVATQGVNIRLIDGHPICDVFLQRLHHFAHILFKYWNYILVFPTAFIIQPERVGEVMQRDHRED